nr:hypothetical protein [Tanacetum cinerariifolium]
MDSIMGNNTWVLTDPHPGYRPLGCKWIFIRKLKVDGTVEKFKERPYIAFAVGKLSRLVYSGYPSVLEGYIDASWISNTEDNSSTSGWVFLHAGKEAEWLKNLLLEIPLWVKHMAPIFIRYDSAATLAKAYSQMYDGKSRHLGVRHSIIRELIINGMISIEFVRSQQNLADHLTKGLSRDLVIKSAEGM